MMAAIGAKSAAREAGEPCEVLLLEKNESLGAKVLISGGGRCNLTSGIFDVKELLKNYPRGAKFLMTAMFRFSPEKVMEWFESHGVALKIEKDKRVFPKSNESRDIVAALEKEMRDAGVKVLFNSAVTSVAKVGEKFQIELKDGQKLDADAVILTTGGNAYRHTGSTGDGYAFATGLGHTITPLAPSLSSFLIGEQYESAGVSFDKAKLTLLRENKKLFERVGPFLFTHRGVSGPAVFALSSYAAHEEITPANPLNLIIDFFPDENLTAFGERIAALINKNPKKHLVGFLDILLPRSLCEAIAPLVEAKSGESGDCTATGEIVGNFTKEGRQKLVRILKEFKLTVTGRSAGEEFVTAGGVNLAEVNTNTMESKICPGLYFAGEILDIDAFTGGFNLQASWATGALAGSCAAA